MTEPTQHCKFKSCKGNKKRFRDSEALEKHYDALHRDEAFETVPQKSVNRVQSNKRHCQRSDPVPEPLPITLVPPVIETQNDAAGEAIEEDHDELHPLLHRLIKRPYKPKPKDAVETEKTTFPKRSGALSKLERMMARFGFDFGVSNAQYKRLVEIVEFALNLDSHTTIKAKTMDKVKSILKSEADPCSLIV
ncbi:hypothetical protein BJV82DRAFT_34174 [Fennellomyces sp. T-0311]|nr:hypothetical protein BJV82DRAFT_34174 [Fennellomyces sp. T-0311]